MVQFEDYKSLGYSGFFTVRAEQIPVKTPAFPKEPVPIRVVLSWFTAAQPCDAHWLYGDFRDTSLRLSGTRIAGIHAAGTMSLYDNLPTTGTQVDLTAEVRLAEGTELVRCVWTGDLPNPTSVEVTNDPQCKHSYHPNRGPQATDTYGAKHVELAVYAKDTKTGQITKVQRGHDYYVFFRKAARDPGVDTANWFEYWGPDGCLPELARPEITWMRGSVYGAYNSVTGRVYVGEIAAGRHYSRNIDLPKVEGKCPGAVFGGATGSDCAAEVVRHELEHKRIHEAWLPGGEYVGMVDSDDTTPDDKADPKSRHPADNLPDNIERNVLGTSPQVIDSCNLAKLKSKTYKNYGDNEFSAMTAGHLQQSVHAKDFANPGKIAAELVGDQDMDGEDRPTQNPKTCGVDRSVGTDFCAAEWVVPTDACSLGACLDIPSTRPPTHPHNAHAHSQPSHRWCLSSRTQHGRITHIILTIPLIFTESNVYSLLLTGPVNSHSNQTLWAESFFEVKMLSGHNENDILRQSVEIEWNSEILYESGTVVTPEWLFSQGVCLTLKAGLDYEIIQSISLGPMRGLIGDLMCMPNANEETNGNRVPAPQQMSLLKPPAIQLDTSQCSLTLSPAGLLAACPYTAHTPNTYHFSIELQASHQLLTRTAHVTVSPDAAGQRHSVEILFGLVELVHKRCEGPFALRSITVDVDSMRGHGAPLLDALAVPPHAASLPHSAQLTSRATFWPMLLTAQQSTVRTKTNRGAADAHDAAADVDAAARLPAVWLESAGVSSATQEAEGTRSVQLNVEASLFGALKTDVICTLTGALRDLSTGRVIRRAETHTVLSSARQRSNDKQLLKLAFTTPTPAHTHTPESSSSNAETPSGSYRFEQIALLSLDGRILGQLPIGPVLPQ